MMLATDPHDRRTWNIEQAPVVSCHDRPQYGPQQYGCGCVTAIHVTDRDASRGEKPFELRLVHACPGTGCELACVGD